MQAAERSSLRRADLALCVGTESMSRNPVAAYTHRGGFRMGQVEFKDFLWEALLDPAANVTMGDTAENLARQYQITRPEVDEFAARSFARARRGAAERLPRRRDRAGDERDLRAAGYKPRGIRLKGAKVAGRHPRAPLAGRGAGQDPAGLRRRADRRQQSAHRRRRGGRAGRSAPTMRKHGKAPLARLVAGAAVGCRRRSWASARCRRSARCWSAPA